MSSNPNEPSLVSGHAQYAKGYVSETVGNMTGSAEWKESEKRDTQSGLEEMKAANRQRQDEPAASGIGGKVEELAGRATGCVGMEQEGKARQEKAT